MHDSGKSWTGFRLTLKGWETYGEYCCEDIEGYNGPSFVFYLDVDGGPPGFNEVMRIFHLLISDGNYLNFDIDILHCCTTGCMRKVEIYGDPIARYLIRFDAFDFYPRIIGRFGSEVLYMLRQPFAIVNQTGEAWREYHLTLVGTDAEDAPFPFVCFTDIDEDQVIYNGPGTPILTNPDGIDGPEKLIIRELNVLPGDTLIFNADISGYPPVGLDSLDIVGYPLPHITEATVEEMAHSSQLYQNQPNPFNPVTYISFYIPESARVLLEIFDVKGRQVRSLCNRTYDKGMHKVMWDGRENSGTPAVSGVYFYKLTAGKETRFRKMVLLR